MHEIHLRSFLVDSPESWDCLSRLFLYRTTVSPQCHLLLRLGSPMPSDSASKKPTGCGLRKTAILSLSAGTYRWQRTSRDDTLPSEPRGRSAYPSPAG